MSVLTKIIIAMTAVAACLYGLWASIDQTIHLRYKLTLEVRDGEQIKVGSSVIDVAYTIYPDGFLGGAMDNVAHIDGYAPTVDLEQKGLLFLSFEYWIGIQKPYYGRGIECLMSYFQCLPFAAFGHDRQFIGSAYSQRKLALLGLLKEKGERELPVSSLPELLTFKRIDDPYSVERVSPSNLAEWFGPEVKFSRVLIELTDKPVTPIPKIWPNWLKSSSSKIGILRGGVVMDQSTVLDAILAMDAYDHDPLGVWNPDFTKLTSYVQAC